MNALQGAYNVYCDESCHLEKDHQPVMLLGAIWCRQSFVKRIALDLRGLKKKHNALGELKWAKVSKSKEAYYLELTDYFFRTDDLHFRCLVVANKAKLKHADFNQGSHDTFYYKMYFSLLKAILSPTNTYYIYLDIKDTRSKQKIEKLHEVLCNNVHDFTQEMVARIQHIRSHESELLQIADFLIGAVGYRNRDLKENVTKAAIVAAIEKEIGGSLHSSTSLFQEKFNLFIFSPR